MSRLRFLAVLYMLFAIGNSTPTWMWVGTYGIDNYSGNGSPPAYNLPQSVAGANEFMDAAEAWCPDAVEYTQAQKRDAECTFSNVSNNYYREMCDFIYFDGHGDISTLYLGDGAGYGSVYPDDMDLGTMYTRWAYWYTCCTLRWVSKMYNIWDHAFSGVQTVLGFASVTWAVSYKENIHSYFWVAWSEYETDMLSSYFDAIEYWLYNHGGLDVDPALLSWNGTCWNDYFEMTSVRGGHPDSWYHRVLGNPIYP